MLTQDIRESGRQNARLLARDRERAAIDQFVDNIRRGPGGALVVRGEPGIGKTALVGQALAAARDVRQLRVVGREFEVDFDFAALHQLCAPILEDICHLEKGHRAALEHVFALAEGQAVDRLRVGLAIRALFAAVTELTPCLCVVDDAQWLDQSSAEVLAFVARRIGAERFGLLIMVRDPLETRLFQGLPQICLPGLGDRDARSLLAAEIRAPLDPRIRNRIIAEARGNPLALLELPRSVTPADLAGGYMLPDRLPVSGVIEESFKTRLAQLPKATQQLLLVAASEPIGDPILTWRAADLLGINRDAIHAAEAAGLLKIDHRVTFSHPLARSATYRAASPAQRRSVHLALANVTDAAVDPDRRAWHRAQASHAPDESVAAELVRSATRARSRGGVAAAAAFLERAVALTPDTGDRTQRMLDAAQAKYEAGATATAYSLLVCAEDGPLDADRSAMSRVLRGRLAFTSGKGDAPDHLLAGANMLSDLRNDQAWEIYLEAFAAGLWAGRFADGNVLERVASTVRSKLRPDVPIRPITLLLKGLTAQALDSHTAAVPLLRRAVHAFLHDDLSPSDARWLWLACSSSTDIWDEHSWRDLAERQIDFFRHEGILSSLPIALHYRALAHVHAGEFNEAGSLVEEARAVAAAGGAGGVSCAELLLSAWLGDTTLTSTVIEQSTKEAHDRGEGRTLTAVELAAAVLYNGRGQYPQALASLKQAGELDEPGLRSYVPVELIEAAVRSGANTVAAEALERLTERTCASDSAWACGMEVRSRALLTDDSQAEVLYKDAITSLELTQAKGHLARARLIYGEWLRRQGRRVDARSVLRAAHDSFLDIGVQGFANRAARELRATGEVPLRRSAEATTALTAQEFCVAELVSTGATTKEIAAELFLSPRTVDAHLRNIFKKLGLTSRRELRAHRFSEVKANSYARPVEHDNPSTPQVAARLPHRGLAGR
jgi:DNA-binding CsgD family transcriptional regulator/tetratricopeptide (TPR) repeat protein